MLIPAKSGSWQILSKDLGQLWQDCHHLLQFLSFRPTLFLSDLDFCSYFQTDLPAPNLICLWYFLYIAIKTDLSRVKIWSNHFFPLLLYNISVGSSEQNLKWLYLIVLTNTYSPLWFHLLKICMSCSSSPELLTPLWILCLLSSLCVLDIPQPLIESLKMPSSL